MAEQMTPEDYYNVPADAPIVTPLPATASDTATAAPAPTVVQVPTAPAMSDQMMFGFMVFGCIIVVVTIFGFVLMYRNK